MTRKHLRPERVYLIHLDDPVGHLSHYIGYTKVGVAQRLAAHAAGRGGRLLQVARERGCRWRLARVWKGGLALERKLHDYSNTPRLCPICSGDAAYGRYPEGSMRCRNITSATLSSAAS